MARRSKLFQLRSLLTHCIVAGVNATDDVKLGLLELKPNYKLMMVGSLESDIKEVESAPLDSLVVDDFDDTDDKKEVSIHNSEVSVRGILFFLVPLAKTAFRYLGLLVESEQARQRLSNQGAQSTASQ